MSVTEGQSAISGQKESSDIVEKSEELKEGAKMFYDKLSNLFFTREEGVIFEYDPKKKVGLVNIPKFFRFAKGEEYRNYIEQERKNFSLYVGE